jgi:hypothetical protein
VGQYNIDLNREVENAFAQVIWDLERAAQFATTGEQLGKLPSDTQLPPPDVAVRYGGQRFAEVWETLGCRCAYYSLICMIGACERYLRQMNLITRVTAQIAEKGGAISVDELRETRLECAYNTSSLWLVLRDTLRILRVSTKSLSGRAWFSSLDAVRNCLVHRGGSVDLADTDKRGLFKVTWRKTTVLDPEGQPITSLPYVMKKAGTISMRVEDYRQTWRAGDHIQLTANDCQEMAFTLSHFCSEMKAQVHLGLQKILG